VAKNLCFLTPFGNSLSSWFVLGSSIISRENKSRNNPVHKAVSVKVSHSLFEEDHLVSFLCQNVAPFLAAAAFYINPCCPCLFACMLGAWTLNSIYNARTPVNTETSFHVKVVFEK